MTTMHDRAVAMTHDLKQRARGWCAEHDGVQDLESYADSLTALLLSVHNEAIEKAGKVADQYADVNIEAAGDTVLTDPLLNGAPLTAENEQRTRDAIIDGCVHSSMFHAAQNIATAIRALKQESP